MKILLLDVLKLIGSRILRNDLGKLMFLISFHPYFALWASKVCFPMF